MIKTLGFLLFIFPFCASALVPVEGILLGEAQGDLQVDPLLKIFSVAYDKGEASENEKVRQYFAKYQTGQYLHETCRFLDPPKYATPWEEKQVRRMMAATLQYIGIDTTIKAIGAYAKKLDLNEEQYQKLTKNLVTNYCSKNITVFSIKTIEKSLKYYYDNPVQSMVPSVQSSPFAPDSVKLMSEANSSRSREFDLVTKSFRSFCSWGGEVEDYRLLPSYLSNKVIMNFVITNLLGMRATVTKEGTSTMVPDQASVQVTCRDLVCRKEDAKTFREVLPKSIGSTGYAYDLIKNYCHHFRYQGFPQKTIPQVKEWIKKMEIEDPILETSQFIALMTGVPDFTNSVESYLEIPSLAKSSIDERWTKWANSVLGSFSTDLFYEESFRVKVEPRRDVAVLATKGFQIDFTVTLGEMDRLMKDNDKLSLSFDLRFSKNYLRELRTKWSVLEFDVDLEGQKKFKEDMARYINIQLREKEKLFTQKLWTSEFSKLIADELLLQALTYKGSFFDSYKDEVVRVPVRFSYGLFAISYLRYRSDVAAGRNK